MRSLPTKQVSIEVLKFQDLMNGWIHCQLALDGTPCVPFDCHKSVREQFPREDEFMAYLVRQATSLIEQFGDARAQQAPQA